MTRSNEIKIRFNDEELAFINEKVRKSGLSREEYIRMILKGHVPRDTPQPDFTEMIRQLRRIGNNINQLAVAANRNGVIDSRRYRSDHDDLERRIQEIILIVTQPTGFDV